jgi:uncharacterized protein YndB with AHSA1/START domain
MAITAAILVGLNVRAEAILRALGVPRPLGSRSKLTLSGGYRRMELRHLGFMRVHSGRWQNSQHTGAAPSTMDSSMVSKSRIEKKVLIQASPCVVFKALTEAKDLVHWFCDRATSDPCEGGELVAFWKTGRTSQKGRAVITRFEPESHLEMLWVDEGEESNSTDARHVLSYGIIAKKGSTEVVMCDTDDLPQTPEAIAILDHGWNDVLMELKEYCERKERSGKPRTSTSP